MAGLKDLRQLGTEINTETLSRPRAKKKKKSQHQWAVDTRDVEGNQCTARQKAWIKEAPTKKMYWRGKLKLKASTLSGKIHWVYIHFISRALNHIQLVCNICPSQHFAVLVWSVSNIW